MRGTVRCLVSLVALIALAAPAAAADAKADATDSFQSGGKKVEVERFDPKGKGKHPALVMVHGADGMTKHGKAYRQAARDLAGKGYAVFLVRYFERTGTKSADKEAITKHFLTWMGTLRDALHFVAKRPAVDPERVGMIGYSLGAYLSLSVAASPAKDQVAVKCIVEYFGGLPAVMGALLKKMPPVLILHGEEDEVVPVKEAKDLAAVLEKKKLPFEMKLYSKQKHGFNGKDAEDAAERVFKFLGKHLAAK